MTGVLAGKFQQLSDHFFLLQPAGPFTRVRRNRRVTPVRAGRSQRQIGRKGLSNKRWIVGGKPGFLLNRYGRICAWDCDTANVHDKHSRSMIEPLYRGRAVPLGAMIDARGG